MEMVSIESRQIEKSHLYLVAVAKDSKKYYGAIVDPNTYKCYVEEMGAGMQGEDLTGHFRRIYDDAEWDVAMTFFERHNVFNNFLRGRNWIWSKKKGKLTDLAKRMRQKINTLR